MSAPRSMQARLLVLLLAVLTACWLGAALLAWRAVRGELDALLDAHLAQAAALLVARRIGEVDDDDGEGDDRIAAEAPLLHRHAPKIAFQVWHEGALMLRSGNAPAAPMSAQVSGFDTVSLGAQRWRVFGARGAERDVTVFVAEQVGSRDAIAAALTHDLLWPLVLALPLLALGSLWAVSRGLAPLRRLRALLVTREPHASQPLALPEAMPREIAPLVDALNALFLRIAGLLESERRFTADAAHELRTPIAAIRAQAQVALGAADDDERRHALEATLRGCDRAARLVEQLLMLARLDAGLPCEAEAVDLAALVRRAAAESAPAAAERRHLLRVNVVPGIVVRGDEALLAVLLRNLLDNAIRYCPTASTIEVGADADPGVAARVWVQDSGPGLDAARRATLGQRFRRGAGSGPSGSGLGWSIVQRIAEAHEAQLEVGASTQLGGLRVDVRFAGHSKPRPRARSSRSDPHRA